MCVCVILFTFYLSTEILAPTYVQVEAGLFQAAKVGDAAAVKTLIFEAQVNVNSAHEVCTKCIMCSIFIVARLVCVLTSTVCMPVSTLLHLCEMQDIPNNGYVFRTAETSVIFILLLSLVNYSNCT